MAKVNYGGVVMDARGKMNGLVYSKNKFGPFVRTKVTPTNRNTAAQAQVRANFGELSKQWSSLLTAAERVDWTNLAQNYPRRDVFGNTKVLTGFNMFLSVNQILLQLGQTPHETAPIDQSITPIPTVAGVAFTTSALTFSQTAAAATDTVFYVFGSSQTNAGTVPPANRYRYIGSPAPATGTFPAVIDVTALYEPIFGVPVSGLPLGLLISSVNTNNGAVSVGIPYVGPVT